MRNRGFGPPRVHPPRADSHALGPAALHRLWLPTARAAGDATGGAAVPLVRMGKPVDPRLLG
jgi:hypothetical protein